MDHKKKRKMKGTELHMILRELSGSNCREKYRWDFLSLGRCEPKSTWYVGHLVKPIVPAPDDDDDEYGTVGGISIGRGN
jgi:hypothetical protein